MNKELARKIVKDTFENKFDKEKFHYFIKNLLNVFEEKTFVYRGNYIPTAYRDYINTLERLGKYKDSEENEIDILIVNLNKETSLEQARSMQRNFVAWYLNGSRGDILKDAALVAFVSPNEIDWRFSLVRMEYAIDNSQNGKVKIKKELTPAKRFSFLVGNNESSHTAQSRLVPIIEDDKDNPTLNQLEEAFNIEKVTKEFFEKYRELFLKVKDELDEQLKNDPLIKKDFEDKSISTSDFSKKLLGQIVFLYFLQKKGWFGVKRDDEWGTGPKDFLRKLFDSQITNYTNFFNDILEPLFYEALATERPDNFYSRFNSKIPFLNGGLFDPLNNYDWVHTDIQLPNSLFSNKEKTAEGDLGTAILDVFDRYNFTVKEDEPLEKEVAVDPEMLGKVFENLLEIKDRKSKGAYYTPREIVHYMCQESLANYLVGELKEKIDKKDIDTLIKVGEAAVENDKVVTKAGEETATYFYKLPASVVSNAKEIDEALSNIRVCDPAVGSGAFLVGMMTEIVKVRSIISSYLVDGDRSVYALKHHAIQDNLYGVDIDLGATEIAKLRLWLSLIVEEKDINLIKPLPNLDYKIMQGNSLLQEYEGIKLFDEEIINNPTYDSSSQMNEIKNKINELQREFFNLYSNGGLNSDRRIQIESEIKKHNEMLKKLSKATKSKANNTSLFELVSEAKLKADKLKELQKEFFSISQKKQKDSIKKQIDALTWDLIEATIKEQKNDIKLREIEKFKKANIRPFFLWKLNYSEVFQDKGGFDVIIANPPYVRQEEITYKEGLEKEYDVYNSVSDLYTYFYERGFKLLNTTGTLTFITSNKFLRARYGSFLRSYIKYNVTLRNIINFGDQHIFEAITNTLILIASKIHTSKNRFYFSRSIGNPYEFEFLQDDLNEREWTIEKPEIISIKKIIEDRGTELVEWNIRINYGIKTGFNEAFIIDHQIKEEVVKEDKKSESIIKPIIRGRDIGRYFYRESGLYLITTHNGYKTEEGSEIPRIDVEDFPSIKSHLNKYKSNLEKRQDKGQTIYNLRDCAFMQDFTSEKIIWIELTNRNKFAYSDKEDYILAGAFLMVGDSLKYLLAFLNSKLCHFYFSLICNSSGMATIQWKKFAVEKIPVIKLSLEDQKPFISLVNDILDITNTTDYSINIEKQKEVNNYEKQIDSLFYELYGFDSDEISLIEGTI
ncbi:N-6 DNA methylase [candidate division WWE3 bacterium]|uniref:site-specific DNA-methyltransferase (adenine-specific) n=1 Tax=candidate division WWE3 bacterium TaxID=2053526 RepID=A0A7X9E7K5_UNCKA|nr:N-6 DNA methylase [candidate division WWE3 bacterium]